SPANSIFLKKYLQVMIQLGLGIGFEQIILGVARHAALHVGNESRQVGLLGAVGKLQTGDGAALVAHDQRISARNTNASPPWLAASGINSISYKRPTRSSAAKPEEKQKPPALTLMPV